MLKNRIEELLTQKVIESGDYETRHELEQGNLTESVEMLVQLKRRTKNRTLYGVFVLLGICHLQVVVLLALRMFGDQGESGAGFLIYFMILSTLTALAVWLPQIIQRQVDDTILETLFHLWREDSNEQASVTNPSTATVKQVESLSC